VLLNYEQIRTDGGTQPRAELQKDVMEDYAELMRAGVKFPPLVVFDDDETYWLADGFHRLGAGRMACPDKPIEVEVIQGTQQEAQWYSFGTNKTHGLRRTRQDVARAVRAALLHPQSGRLSDAAIADHVGVHRETVLKYRHQVEAHLSKTDKSKRAAGRSQLSKTGKSAFRTGRDGRTINTARIGRSPRQRPATR
jgi:hypothetical protein